MDNRKYEFKGIYENIFTAYLNYKRSLGFTYDIRSVRDLVILNEYLNSYCSEKIILTEEMALGYIESKKSMCILRCQNKQ